MKRFPSHGVVKFLCAAAAAAAAASTARLGPARLGPAAHPFLEPIVSTSDPASVGIRAAPAARLEEPAGDDFAADFAAKGRHPAFTRRRREAGAQRGVARVVWEDTHHGLGRRRRHEVRVARGLEIIVVAEGESEKEGKTAGEKV